MVRVQRTMFEVRMGMGGDTVAWHTLVLESCEYPVCTLTLSTVLDVGKEVVVRLDSRVIFTGIVRRHVERKRGLYVVEVASDGYKQHERVAGKGWSDVQIRNVLTDVCDAATITVDIANISMVQMKQFSVADGTTVAAVLCQLLEVYAQHVAGAVCGWYFDVKNVLRFGVLADMRGEQVEVPTNRVVCMGRWGTEIVPMAIVYNDVVMFPDSSSARIVATHVEYTITAGKAQRVVVRGQRM